MVCLNKERSVGSQTSSCQSFGHFINGRKLSPGGHSGNSVQRREVVSCLGSISTRKTELTLHEVCNLSFFPAGPDVFESQARRQNKKKLSFLTTQREQVSPECSVSPCPWSQLDTPFPSPPNWALPKDERNSAGAKEVTSPAVVGFLAY